MMSVYGKRCLRPGCTDRVTFEVGFSPCFPHRWPLNGPVQYSDTQLYNQLRYYAYLFDGEAALRCSRGAEHEGWCFYPGVTHPDADVSPEQVRALTVEQAEFLSTLNHTVKRFLNENARCWVDMESLFSVVKIS
jgi:DNA polymerase alpha subunit A